MVGRRAELDTLLDAFDAGREGRPRAVIIRGEAGIGKTRLLQELLAEASNRTAPGNPALVVATGQCIDLGPIGAPFTPIRRLLRDIYLVVGEDAFRTAAGSATVLSTLATMVPELSADAAAPDNLSDYAAEAIERIIENLSVHHHLLLIIEDIHWADTATLALLKTLSVSLRGTHVTMICTYRSDDVGRGHPLRAVLAELDRSRAVTSLTLARLTTEEIAEQARLLTGSTPGADELEMVIARSEGVPFFVEELLGLKQPEIPESLRDIVLARYEHLTTSTRDVVDVVSVGGVHVQYDLLGEVFSGQESALRDGLHEAIAERILTADGDGYTFRHALIQEAVHDELLPSERVALHEAYAVALQNRVDAGDASLAAATAEHWLATRDLTRAFAATVTARDDAIASNALTTAARLGERILELWERVDDAEAHARTSRGELSLTISELYYTHGDFQRALRLAEAGLAFTTPERFLLRAELLRTSGSVLRNLGRIHESSLAYRRAQELLEGHNGDREAATLARVLGGLSILVSSPAGQGELAGRAVTFAEASGDDDALANALIFRAIFQANIGQLHKAADDLRRAVGLPATTFGHFIAVNNLVDTLGMLGRVREAIKFGEHAFAEIVALGNERGLGNYLILNIAELQWHIGDCGSARANAERGLALGGALAGYRVFALRILALAALWEDDAAAYAQLHKQAASVRSGTDDMDSTIGWTVAEAEAALAGVDDAHNDLETVARRLNEIFGVGALGLLVRALPAAARVAVSGASGASELRATIENFLPLIPFSDSNAGYCALVRAELTGGIAAWRTALEAAGPELLPARHLQYTRLRLAEALITADARDEAAALLNQIARDAPPQGVALAARWAREIATRAGVQLEVNPLGDRDRDGDDAQPRTHHATGITTLTAREAQVLQLVAAGFTNPQIGKQLFISPKTASVHVSAILAKIGASNRTEAAAIFATAGSNTEADGTADAG